MMNKRSLTGKWVRMYTDKSKLLPVLGNYNISLAEQSRQRGNLPELKEVDFQPRDIFTRRVRSSAVSIPGVPDIDSLRRKGMCLATEDEVLGSQRYITRHTSTKFSSSSNRIYNTHLKRPRLGSSITTTSALASNYPRSVLSTIDYRRRSLMLQQMETEKRYAMQREIEGRIMKSKEYYYNNRSKDSLPCADGITRKFVSEALDKRHRELLSLLEEPIDEKMDKDLKHSMFQEWKNSAISIMDQQAEDDLKMVAGYKKMVRKQNVSVKPRRQRRPSDSNSMPKVVESARDSFVSGSSWEEYASSKSQENPLQDVKKLKKRKSPRDLQPIRSHSKDLSLASLESGLLETRQGTSKPPSFDNDQ